MESSTETWPIGTAGRVTGLAVVRPAGSDAASATDPQAWHSPQRPTHLVASQPHSEQRNAGRGLFGMAGTLNGAADTRREDRRGRPIRCPKV